MNLRHRQQRREVTGIAGQYGLQGLQRAVGGAQLLAPDAGHRNPTSKFRLGVARGGFDLSPTLQHVHQLVPALE